MSDEIQTANRRKKERMLAGAVMGVLAGLGVLLFAFGIIPGIGHVPYKIDPICLLALLCWGGAGVCWTFV